MSAYRNVTFDEIVPGTTASAQRVLTQTEIEALLLVSGDVVPFHVEDDVGPEPDELRVDAVAAEAIISGMLERRLPGPGTRIVSQQLEFDGHIRVGDEVRATVTAREKFADSGRVVFDCEVIAAGQRACCGARWWSRRRNAGSRIPRSRRPRSSCVATTCSRGCCGAASRLLP